MSTSLLLATYPSKSNPSKSHEVRRGADGTVWCSCPSWRFQKNSPTNRTCKHIESFKASVKLPSGKTLLDEVGPGPVAVRAPRKARKPVAPKPAPVVQPTVSLTFHGSTVAVPVKAETVDLGGYTDDEPEYGSKSWARVG